jgi:hypothetical protein
MEYEIIAQFLAPGYPEEDVATIGYLDASGLCSGPGIFAQLYCSLLGHAENRIHNEDHERMCGNGQHAECFFCAQGILDASESLVSSLCRAMQPAAGICPSPSSSSSRAIGSRVCRRIACFSSGSASLAILIRFSPSTASACSMGHSSSHLISSASFHNLPVDFPSR